MADAPLRLLRGISVPSHEADATIEEIRRHGLTADGPRLRTQKWPLRDPRSMLLDAEISTDLRHASPRPADCAADEVGATFYACRPNRHHVDYVPILIELDAGTDQVCVDGNDTLHRLFLRYAKVADVRRALPACYGNAILPYAERAWSSEDPLLRIALAKLAASDPDVIAVHHGNHLVIEGLQALH